MEMDEEKEGRWVPCPVCGKKTKTKVYEDTVVVNFPLYCSMCGNETRVNVVQYKVLPSKRK